MEITILMPCLNEAETLAHCIQQAKSFFANEKIEGEVLVSDNGSCDGSQEIAIKYGAKVIHTPTRGYGAALINGINFANGRYIIMGDADASYDFSSLMPFVNKLREGQDLVMGNRFRGGIKPGAMPFLNRYLGNPVLSFLGRLFFKSKIGDFHCGLRGFNKQAIGKINLRSSGMEFASEMVVKASLSKLKITEVPTTLSPDGRSRPPHLRKWRDGWRHLSLLLLFSPRWLFLYPGLFFTFLGGLLLLILSITSIQIGGFLFGIHTMLFGSMFLIVGTQTIFFSLFSRILAHISLNIDLNENLEKLLKRFTLEKGIIIGLILMAAGSIGSCISFEIWANTKFGDLAPTETMRIVIPSITCLISGIQIIFSSFFMTQLISLGLKKSN